jgi:hypothetical protein
MLRTRSYLTWPHQTSRDDNGMRYQKLSRLTWAERRRSTDRSVARIRGAFAQQPTRWANSPHVGFGDRCASRVTNERSSTGRPRRCCAAGRGLRAASGGSLYRRRGVNGDESPLSPRA